MTGPRGRRRRPRGARGRRVHTLTRCPFCGYKFDCDERRHKHLGEHDPEDAGLGPLGEIPENHDRPLLAADRGEHVAD